MIFILFIYSKNNYLFILKVTIIIIIIIIIIIVWCICFYTL